jgi:hypothetical protein
MQKKKKNPSKILRERKYRNFFKSNVLNLYLYLNLLQYVFFLVMDYNNFNEIKLKQPTKMVNKL